MPTPSPSPDSLQVWSRLWRTGALHSCATGISGNYDGAIEAFWARQFSCLSEGNTVVDLGTGNGALTLLAKDHATTQGMTLHIHGVDLADIDPPSSVADGPPRFAGIHFHPLTSITELPFGDGCVDLVTSQYAFEYAPREAALAEIVRVIGPNGRAALVLHSRDSLVTQVTARQLEGCLFVLDQSELFERTRAMVRVMAAPPGDRLTLPGRAYAEETRNAFNATARSLVDRINEVDAPLLKNVAIQVQQALRLAPQARNDALAMLDRAEAAMRDERQRLRHLGDAIMEHRELEALAVAFGNAGFGQIALAPLDLRDGVRMGWSLEVAP